MSKDKKLFIQTQGGLGNQLFQFNFAHQLAELFHEYSVYLIDGSIGNDRKYAVGDVLSTCPHLSKNWRGTKFGKLYLRLLYGFKRRWPNFKFSNYILLAPKSAFQDPAPLIKQINQSKSRMVYIRGDFINNEFPVSECLIRSIENLNLDSIRGKESYDVVVHIRRGDYLLHRNYGPISLEYFERLLLRFPTKYRVLIHTDDREYVSQNLRVKQNINFVGKEVSPFQLIRDSQRSFHFIGSNSTLSWWAATLLELSFKTDPSNVLMPSVWFRDQTTVNYSIVNQSWSLFDPIWDK
jgi:hypothetical protein